MAADGGETSSGHRGNEVSGEEKIAGIGVGCERIEVTVRVKKKDNYATYPTYLGSGRNEPVLLQ